MNRTTVARWLTIAGLLAVLASLSAGQVTAVAMGPTPSSIVPVQPGGLLVRYAGSNQDGAIPSGDLQLVTSQQLLGGRIERASSRSSGFPILQTPGVVGRWLAGVIGGSGIRRAGEELDAALTATLRQLDAEQGETARMLVQLAPL